MNNIINLKLKLKTLMKTITKLFILVLLGFVLILSILIIKYKPAYEVTLSGETLGYISEISKLEDLINNEIINQTGGNIDSVSLKENPQYELKLLSRKQETNELEIISSLKEDAIITYKFYAVTLNDESKAYVDTIEEAEEVVNEIKSEYDGNGLELNLAITEVYTQNQEEVTTEGIEVAELSVQNEVEELIQKKEAEEAIATINGINLSVLPVSGRITSRFAEVSSIRSSVPHTGLDIACNKGTDIKVVAKGTVIFSGWGGDLRILS